MKKRATPLESYIKAVKKGNREAEKEIMGHGFHATTHIHRSRKCYTRKQKHKLKFD